MEIDGDYTDDEPLGHLRAGQALGEQAQHFDLSRGVIHAGLVAQL